MMSWETDAKVLVEGSSSVAVVDDANVQVGLHRRREALLGGISLFPKFSY